MGKTPKVGIVNEAIDSGADLTLGEAQDLNKNYRRVDDGNPHGAYRGANGRLGRTAEFENERLNHVLRKNSAISGVQHHYLNFPWTEESQRNHDERQNRPGITKRERRVLLPDRTIPEIDPLVTKTIPEFHPVETNGVTPTPYSDMSKSPQFGKLEALDKFGNVVPW